MTDQAVRMPPDADANLLPLSAIVPSPNWPEEARIAALTAVDKRKPPLSVTECWYLVTDILDAVTPILRAQGAAAEREPGTDVRFYDDDADLVAECPCGWHAHGDSATDAFRAWWKHRRDAHADLLDGTP